MKKIFAIMAFAILASSFVFAVSANDYVNQEMQVAANAGGQRVNVDTTAAGDAKVTVTSADGQDVEVDTTEGRARIRAGDVDVDADGMDVSVEGDKVSVKLSNGRNAEVKVMPSTASETALARLRLKVCSTDNNCTIELKQVGTGENSKVAYEVQAERHAKLLGLFATKMEVRAEVNAETGEVKVGKPWWAFLATEPAE